MGTIIAVSEEGVIAIIFVVVAVGDPVNMGSVRVVIANGIVG
jgi:hypothetical protein